MSSLGALRHKVADALEPLGVPVHPDPVEAVDPPCYLMAWGGPWLEQSTFSLYDARPAVICVAGRLNLADGFERLEAMVEDAVRPLRDLGALERVDTVGALSIGGVDYLAARITIRTTLSL